jgi:hypothetical protein
MGTPHQGGSGVRLGKLLINVASVFVAADDGLIKHLERDSEWLQQQLGQYGPISADFVTKFAYEEYETPTKLGHSIWVCPLAKSCAAITDQTGGATHFSRSTRRCRCRVDRHPCRPYPHGQV